MFTSLATALRNSIESMILIFQECCFGINISSVPLITIPRGRVPVLCQYHWLVQVPLSNGHMVLGYCSGVRINRKYPHSVHSSFTPRDLPSTDFFAWSPPNGVSNHCKQRERTASSKTSTPVDTQGSVPSWGNLQNGTESSKDDHAHFKDKDVRLPAMD